MIPTSTSHGRVANEAHRGGGEALAHPNMPALVAGGAKSPPNAGVGAAKAPKDDMAVAAPNRPPAAAGITPNAEVAGTAAPNAEVEGALTLLWPVPTLEGYCLVQSRQCPTATHHQR